MVSKPQPQNQYRPTGLPVDVSGGPTIDPTANVIALQAASSQRQDDLREANNKWIAAGLSHAKELAALRDECNKEMALLRETHSKEMQHAEASRLNAIRQIDQNSLNTAADRAQIAIQALANTTSQTFGSITERIAALEKSSYEGVGKQRVSDPQLDRLAEEVKALRTSTSTGEGKSAGISMSWAVLIGVVSLIVGLLGIGGILYAALKP